MHQVTPKVEPISNVASQNSSLSRPQAQHSYARMSNRRAIACTICAKAKTKCDKAVPSCSRCTAKNLPCEPRSTRRTSDSSYRATAKKQIVSPKHFRSASTIPSLSRHGSPRSVPGGGRHQLVRAMSHMDMSAASKLHQQPNFPGLPMYPSLNGYTPQIVDEYYSDYSSPEPNMGIFGPPTTKNAFLNTGRLTPQTPESFTYEQMPATNHFHQYANLHAFPDDGSLPIGLGLNGEMPDMMLTEPDMRLWTPELDDPTTHIDTTQAFDTPLSQSPTSLGAWQKQSLSVSPPQLSHTRAVPSLSESSAQDFESSDDTSEDTWNHYRVNSNEMVMTRPSVSGMYRDTIKMHPTHPQWEDVILPRSSTF